MTPCRVGMIFPPAWFNYCAAELESIRPDAVRVMNTQLRLSPEFWPHVRPCRLISLGALDRERRHLACSCAGLRALASRPDEKWGGYFDCSRSAVLISAARDGRCPGPVEGCPNPAAKHMSTYMCGLDIGGTFTDCVIGIVTAKCRAAATPEMDAYGNFELFPGPVGRGSVHRTRTDGAA